MCHQSDVNVKSLKEQISSLATTSNELQTQIKIQSTELKQSHNDAIRHQNQLQELKDKLQIKSEVIRRQVLL